MNPPETTVYSLNSMCIEAVAFYLDTWHDKNVFFITLISGNKEPNTIYRELLLSNILRLSEHMIRLGEKVGWTYKSNFHRPTKAKRIAKKWKNPYYCQACGKYSESARDLHFISRKSALRLCTACLLEEWISEQCWCEEEVAFTDHPKEISLRLTGPYDLLTRAHRVAFGVKKWYAICKKRLMFMRCSSLRDTYLLLVEDAENPCKPLESGKGCAFRTSISTKYFLDPKSYKNRGLPVPSEPAAPLPTRRSERLKRSLEEETHQRVVKQRF